MARAGYQTYSISSTQFAAAGTQVSLLLTAAARHIEEARTAMEAANYEARFRATERAGQILTGLRSCLKHDAPGAMEIAGILDGYYAQMLAFLCQINVKNDKPLADAVIDSLRTMAATWREVQAKVDHQTVTASPAPARDLAMLSA